LKTTVRLIHADLLITGFGRFPGSPVDPSGLIATRLAQRRRPASAGTRRIALVFPVTTL
jgi:pyroglutamyl-peptidase